MSNEQTSQKTQEIVTGTIPSLDEILEDAPENEPSILPEDLRWIKQQEGTAQTSQIVIERKCSECGIINQTGIFVCENCGMILATKEVSTVDGQPLVAEPAPTHTTKFSADTEDDPAQPRSISSSNIANLLGGTFVFMPGMILRLRMRNFSDPLDFILQPGQKLTVGRSDKGDPNQPDVDFASYNALQYGISRTHALFEFRGKSIFLTDLGSTNGTFLNGIRFDQNESHELRMGDFIKFGKMVIAVEFIEHTNPEHHQTGRKKTQVLTNHD